MEQYQLQEDSKRAVVRCHDALYEVYDRAGMRHTATCAVCCSEAEGGSNQESPSKNPSPGASIIADNPPSSANKSYSQIHHPKNCRRPATSRVLEQIARIFTTRESKIITTSYEHKPGRSSYNCGASDDRSSK